jgi:hypothetical protein
MRLPVDTSALRFTVVGAPEPLQLGANALAPAGRRVPRGEDGAPWRVPLLVAGADAEEVMRVTVAGDPRLGLGTPVRVEGLSLLTCKRAGGCGWSLRARAIREIHGDAS